jgi:hypothetical protein
MDIQKDSFLGIFDEAERNLNFVNIIFAGLDVENRRIHDDIRLITSSFPLRGFLANAKRVVPM